MKLYRFRVVFVKELFVELNENQFSESDDDDILDMVENPIGDIMVDGWTDIDIDPDYEEVDIDEEGVLI